MTLFLLVITGFAVIVAAGYLLSLTISEDESMTIDEFAVLVTKYEGLKKQVNIAQVKELLKVINFLLRGRLYKIIKSEKHTYLRDYAMPIINDRVRHDLRP